MNKITDIFIEHCVDGDLWPLLERYVSRYSGLFASEFLHEIYNCIKWDVRNGTESELQSLLMQLIDLAFDEIDEKELDAAAIKKFKEQKQDTPGLLKTIKPEGWWTLK